MTDVMLSARRVRAMLGLAGEVREILGAAGDPTAHLAEGLTKLISGDTGALVFSPLAAKGPMELVRLVPFGFSPSEAREVESFYVKQQLIGNNPAASQMPLNLAPGRVSAARRRDLIEDETWYRSDFVNTYRRSWGIDESLYVAYVATDGRVIAFACCREWGAPPFSDEDTALAQLFFERSAPRVVGGGGPRLSRRQRQVLCLLLEGHAAKRIASDLNLSVHTVNEYIQAVYRAFRVDSRAALMAQNLAGHLPGD